MKKILLPMLLALAILLPSMKVSAEEIIVPNFEQVAGPAFTFMGEGDFEGFKTYGYFGAMSLYGENQTVRLVDDYVALLQDSGFEEVDANDDGNTVEYILAHEDSGLLVKISYFERRESGEYDKYSRLAVNVKVQYGLKYQSGRRHN